ncbi:hypothetical protein IID20_02655 [Patescibacteria group bacterium]|nr:hypothetical protein [Patescibacteria group bacterium]
MSKEKRLSKGIRKHIRQEKARIRREGLDSDEQKRLIAELYRKVTPNS